MMESSPPWLTAIELMNSTRSDEAYALIQDMLVTYPDNSYVCYVAGLYLMTQNNFAPAVEYLRQSVALNPDYDNARIFLALCLARHGSQNSLAEARDRLLGLFDADPHYATTHPMADYLVRQAAGCCGTTGRTGDSIRLLKMLSARTRNAEDFFNLSEVLAHEDRFPEAMAALEQAAASDPDKYAKLCQDLRPQLNKTISAASQRAKRAVYPTTKAFTGDLDDLIRKHIIGDLADAPKFVGSRSRFLLAGACYSHLFSQSLKRLGYATDHIDLNERVFTTYGMRALIDWISGALDDNSDLALRLQEILYEKLTKEIINQSIRKSDVFILGLGTSPSFFDKKTGQFVIPATTNIGRRALSEDYDYRTVTVEENVANLIYIMSYVRRINPEITFIIQVAPNPLHMTFEFNSAVTADCLSKSILRVAAHEIAHHPGIDKTYYWPSLEIFRWVSGHRGAVFGIDDGSPYHVAESWIDADTRCFVDMFKTPD